MISEIAIYFVFAYILPTLALVGFVYIFVKLAVLGHSLYKWAKFQMRIEERVQNLEGDNCANHNAITHKDYEIRMLTARVHMLEREMHVTNSFHRAEMSAPEKGFHWFDYERGAHDDL